jgi:hypothetical protein
VNKESVINFDSKMCIPTIYVNVQKAFNSNPEADGTTEYSFEISSEYVSWGSCSYIHENAFAYCGESNLEDCRNCKRQGCTIVQCGNEVKDKSFEVFVT